MLGEAHISAGPLPSFMKHHSRVFGLFTDFPPGLSSSGPRILLCELLYDLLCELLLRLLCELLLRLLCELCGITGLTT